MTASITGIIDQLVMEKAPSSGRSRRCAPSKQPKLRPATRSKGGGDSAGRKRVAEAVPETMGGEEKAAATVPDSSAQAAPRRSALHRGPSTFLSIMKRR